MSFVPTTIATLATSSALEDLRILLGTLELFNVNPPTVYIFCDSIIATAVPKMKYSGRVHLRDVLGKYTEYDRKMMETMPGVHFGNMWLDFMTEKINLLRWAITDVSGGALFCDADICFTGPLPSMPIGTKVALSPHMIVERDERRFGKYNGGFAWFSAVEYADVWWEACYKARYFEQSALEDVAKYAGGYLYEFPKATNYGWWRLWQGARSSSELLKEWAVNRTKCKDSSGLCVQGIPLASIHTHFETNDMATKQFNAMFIGWLSSIAPYHLPARKLLGILNGPKA
jgi:hypothetical protein